MSSEIDKFKEKLKIQVDRAESLTTLGDFYAVSYDFVEIIENDPIKIVPNARDYFC